MKSAFVVLSFALFAATALAAAGTATAGGLSNSVSRAAALHS